MAFCSKCGTQLNDNVGFCPSCGTPNQAQGFANANNTTPNFTQNISYQAPDVKKSTWDGGVLDTIVNSIIASLITSFTCGIATPWALCYMMDFIIGHTIINGKRLKFNGTGGSLFTNWIKWLILTIITCGIYSFWVTPRLYRWVAEHITTED